jgi:hypothetical protein
VLFCWLITFFDISRPPSTFPLSRPQVLYHLLIWLLSRLMGIGTIQIRYTDLVFNPLFHGTSRHPVFPNIPSQSLPVVLSFQSLWLFRISPSFDSHLKLQGMQNLTFMHRDHRHGGIFSALR